MSRASKASWTGMLNSVMILVFLTNGAPVSDAMEVLEGTSGWPVP